MHVSSSNKLKMQLKLAPVEICTSKTSPVELRAIKYKSFASNW